MFDTPASNIVLVILIALFFAAVAWLIVATRIQESEQDLLGELPAQREPLDGRWCPRPDCGGLLAYKRYRAVDGAGRISYQTCLFCWRCGNRFPVHSEPDYERSTDGRPEREE